MMAFIKLHDSNRREVVVNTDNITYFNDDYIFFNDGDDNGLEIYETQEEIINLIKIANAGR